MSYHDLLYRYGYEQDSAEVRPYIYIQHPRKLSTPEQIMYRDKDAAENIRRLESIIADLKDYRQALATRYGELKTMPYTRLLKLERCPTGKGTLNTPSPSPRHSRTRQKSRSFGKSTQERNAEKQSPGMSISRRSAQALRPLWTLRNGNGRNKKAARKGGFPYCFSYQDSIVRFVHFSPS